MPIGDIKYRSESCALEEREGGGVAFGNEGVELVQAKVTAAVLFQQAEGLKADALLAVLAQNGDAYFGTEGTGIVAGEVDEADGLPGVFNDEAQFAALGDVGSHGLDVMAQGVARVGRGGGADIPHSGVVLYGVEERKVFGLKGAEYPLRPFGHLPGEVPRRGGGGSGDGGGLFIHTSGGRR